jgi:hypothetical protein
LLTVPPLPPTLTFSPAQAELARQAPENALAAASDLETAAALDGKAVLSSGAYSASRADAVKSADIQLDLSTIEVAVGRSKVRLDFTLDFAAPRAATDLALGAQERKSMTNIGVAVVGVASACLVLRYW